MYCDQRSQYIRPKSKKNSFRGNYSRKYGIWFQFQEILLSSAFIWGAKGEIFIPGCNRPCFAVLATYFILARFRCSCLLKLKASAEEFFEEFRLELQSPIYLVKMLQYHFRNYWNCIPFRLSFFKTFFILHLQKWCWPMPPICNVWNYAFTVACQWWNQHQQLFQAFKQSTWLR